MVCKVISIRKCNIFERIVKNKYTCCKSNAANLEGVITLEQQVPCGSLDKQHVYFINYPDLLTYTSNQKKIMRVFAVLILVSSLTYSPIKPESKCFRVGSKYPKHIDCYCCQHYPFVSLWMFEQNGLQSLKELKQSQ
jgi:hypothetical protein